MKRTLLPFLFWAVWIFADAHANAALTLERPNIVVVFIDDMGWGDFSCFGNSKAQTPNIDAMAKEGIGFHQFYVNLPICSPSRVAISTGRYPQRYRISSFLNNRKANKKRGMANWLDPVAPMLARSLQGAGHATADGKPFYVNVWGPGLIADEAKGKINKGSVFSAIDIVPSLLDLASVSAPVGAKFDGENMAETLIGKADQSRTQPIFFRRPPDRKDFHDFKNLPDLAVRDGNWKVLCDYDGGRVRLHDLTNDPSEQKNLAEQNPDVAKRLVATTLEWNKSLPADAGDPDFDKAN